MKALVALGAAIAAFLLAMVGGLALLVLIALGGHQANAQPAGTPSHAALADIPPGLLPVYQEAARTTCNMRWAILAAIGKVETDHGRSTLPGVASGSNVAGAKGPMQFLQPTWNAYGIDGDNDGNADVYNVVDAIWGAANYLCASGAGDPQRVRDAIWAYNRAGWYVDKVLQQAAAYEAAPALGTGHAVLLANHPNLSLTPRARQDLLDGIIDQRVVDFLAWAVERHTISVSVLRSGHSQFVAGTDRISNHWYGRAVDIYAVDGEIVGPGSSAAKSLAIEATDSSPPGRSTEIGLPWADLENGPGVFSDAAHQGDLHFGWRGST